MLGSRSSRKSASPCSTPSGRDLDLTLHLAVPIMDAQRMDFQQHDARCLDALWEPSLHVVDPVLLERQAIARQARLALDADEDAGLAEQTLIAGEGEPPQLVLRKSTTLSWSTCDRLRPAALDSLSA